MAKSLIESGDSIRNQTKEAQLLVSPWLFSEFQHALDKSPSLDSFLTGDSRLFNKFLFGIEQKTDFGLSGRIAYGIEYYSLSGIEPITIMPGLPALTLISTPEYYKNKLGTELKWDFLRNASGIEVKAIKNAIREKNDAVYYEKRFQAKQVFMQSEIAYWNLSLAKETVKIHEQLLERANKLDTWMQERIKLNLQDQSDINQSRSEVQYRKLELAGAVDALRSAERTFNVLRGLSSERVDDDLLLPDEKDLAVILDDIIPENREDIISLAKNMESLKQNAVLKKEALKPELSLGLAASINAQDANFGKTAGYSAGLDKYTYGIGVNFRMPMGAPVVLLSKAYDEEWQSIEKYIQSKRIELTAENEELKRKLLDMKERLLLAIELARLQKNKADAEREKLRKGNSVTYQVLMFEQDWSKSELAVIEIKKGILEIIARLKMFLPFEDL